MVVLPTGSPISAEFPSPISADFSIYVRLAIGFVVTCITKALLFRVLNLAEWPAVGRVLVVQTFFHFITSNDGVHSAPGNIQNFKNDFIPGPNPCLKTIWSQRSTVFLSLHGFVFGLTCTVKCGTVYIQVYAFLIMFNYLKLLQMDTSQDISR